jgi:hypothetical protein
MGTKVSIPNIKARIVSTLFLRPSTGIRKNLCESAKRIRNRVEKHMNQRKSRRANENRVNLTETESAPLKNRKRTPSWRDVLNWAKPI